MKEKKQKDKEEKERKEKEKEKRRIEKEKKEKERKEKEEKERIENERIEKENEEKVRIEKERKKKEKEEIKKEKENKKKEELKRLFRGRTEDKLIKEDIKNDDDNKNVEFYKTYINNLEYKKIKNQEQEEEDIKKYYNFMPMINKHPENIYLKAISYYRINKERLKSYNKKAGLFDIHLNRPRTNKFYINPENRENSDVIDDKEEIINKMKTSSKNLHSRNNKNELKKFIFQKKKISLKIGRGNSTIYNYQKMNNPLMKSFHNKFSTCDLSNHRNNNSKKEYKLIKKENNKEITLDEMINYLCEKENEKLGQKQGEISNPNSSRRNGNIGQKNKIFNSLNEPLNPYSPLFYNNILNLNYNAGIQYKGMERGVPHLQIKKLKKPSLPLINSRISLNKERLISNTFSSCYKLYKDSKLDTLPSSSSRFNKSNSKNKSNKSLKENKILVQNYCEKKRFNENNKQNQNNEKLINDDDEKE